MDESAEREVYTQHETLKGKFVFFLLAAAGACIALCVRRTTPSVGGSIDARSPIGCSAR
ncbi:MAG: hypothetical protein IID41_11955 [Planctomycetes bacterium]|nr:hypothetical protein [Planctomycetota bacterium]